jgi:hypothetical protein
MIENRARLGVALLGSALGVLLAADPARADDLTITTRELGSWNAAVAALRADLHGEGRTVHVQVLLQGTPVPCDRYRLELDEAARSAFRTGRCDPLTQETPLVLERRAGLFDEGFHVPRPRTVSLTAIMRAEAVAGGHPQGGSAVHCSMAVQPYLDDLLHGTRVLLTPERYALRPGSSSVTVSPDATGWSFSTKERATVHIQYEVIDRASGDVVLRQDTTLTCGVAEKQESFLVPQARVEVLWNGTWYLGEVIKENDDGTFRVYTGFSWSWSRSFPRSSLRRPASVDAPRAEERRAEPAPLPAVTHVYSGPVAEVCKWGRGKRGCNPSPAGPAVMFTVLALAAAGTMAGGVYGYVRNHDGLTAIPIALGSVGTVIWAPTAGYFFHELAHPPGEPPVRPSVALSSRSATLDLSVAF